MYNDSIMFLDNAKDGMKNKEKIKMWRGNATELADKLNEMDERRWSKGAGEKLFHEFQDSIIINNGETTLNGFSDIRDNAVKVGMFMA